MCLTFYVVQLPPGWFAEMDTARGQFYYFNRDMGYTTWNYDEIMNIHHDNQTKVSVKFDTISDDINVWIIYTSFFIFIVSRCGMESSEDSRWENIFLSCYNASNHLDHCRYLDINYLAITILLCVFITN